MKNMMLKTRLLSLALMLFLLLTGVMGCSRGGFEQVENSTQNQPNKKLTTENPVKKSSSSPAPLVKNPHPTTAKQIIAGEEDTTQIDAKSDSTVPQELIDRAKKLEVYFHTSARVNLWSDLPEQDVAQLLPLCDQLLLTLDQYFAKSPLAKLNEGRKFTGYLIHDREKFGVLDFLPKGVVTSEHGTYFEEKFWVSDQPTDYYRRHLVFHELVHAYMNVRPNNWPEAYQEGMAEFLATHRQISNRLIESKKIEFKVFPQKFSEHSGWTRLQTIQQEIKLEKPLSLMQIVDLKDQSFPNNLTAYSWSWGWAYFLANHPLTKSEFLELATPQSREIFKQKFLAMCGDNLTHLELEWKIFTHQISAGSHYPDSFIELPAGELKDVSEYQLVHEIEASQGWQQTGWQVRAGQKYEITADGEVILDTVPADWVSQPNGVGLRYSLNQPLGVLQLAIYTKEDGKPQLDPTDFQHPVKVGGRWTYKARQNGQLYFRVNDFWTEIWNNKGSYRVKVKKL